MTSECDRQPERRANPHQETGGPPPRGPADVNPDAMKTLPVFAALLAAPLVLAGPINRQHISEDARWILHLDADAFRASKVGARFIEGPLTRRTRQFKADLQRELDFELDWKKIRSITVYGARFEMKNDPTGVALIETSLPVQKALERALERNIAKLKVTKLGPADAPVYCLNDKTHVMFAAGGLILAGSRQEVVEKGCRVLLKKSPSLAASQSMTGYPSADPGFFFVALAEGFAQRADLPPKAALLKQAEGARFTLGEDGDHVRAQLQIRLASTDVAQQLQQVAQGLVAFALLNSNQVPDGLRTLAQSVKTAASDRVLTINASMGTSELLRRLDEAD